MKNENMFVLKATGLSFLFFTQIISTSAIFDTLKLAVNYLEKQNYMILVVHSIRVHNIMQRRSTLTYFVEKK